MSRHKSMGGSDYGSKVRRIGRILALGLVALFLSVLFLHPNQSAAEPLQASKHMQRMADSTTPSMMSCTADSLAALRQINIGLLNTEYTLREENLLNQQNMLSIVRIFLLIIITGFAMLTYLKAKISQTDISRLVMLALVIVLVSVYWYDQFTVDGQIRASVRINEIPVVLNQIPTMTGVQLHTITYFPNLVWPEGFFAKLGLFVKKPNFGQFISYFPMIIIIALLIYRSRTMKKM